MNKKYALIEHLITDYQELDKVVDDIVVQVGDYMKNFTKKYIRDEIYKAYFYARDAHEGDVRKSGEPYIVHPVLAVRELITIRPDLVTIQACFLHDVPEDTDRTVEDIEKHFGSEVAQIAGGMEKLSKVRFVGEERTIGSLRKMFVSMTKDLRIILVKFADRIHNMRTLHYHPKPDKQARIAAETLNIYAPIADRLGIYGFKDILETLSFRFLYSDEYDRITKEMKELESTRRMFEEEAKEEIVSVLSSHIPIDIGYRTKTPYSIYKKMQRKGYEKVADLYDLFAMRITTDTVGHCYEILGEIHSHWTPLPNRFKDYIALPKENGYQSLHTTVVGLLRQFRKQPTEIQMRTDEMHKMAEIGIAAHFDYSESGKAVNSSDFSWVQEIKQIADDSVDSNFMSDMKMSVFNDRIFVFTPKGDVINLPKGSTPVDFAYAIHTDLGDHISLARVNSRVVSLDQVLSNGETVEVITDKNRYPRSVWLSFVKTQKAKEQIKSYLNKENKEELLERGKAIMNAYLQKHVGIELDKNLSILSHVDGRILDQTQKEELLVQLGNLSRKPNSVLKSIYDNNPIFKELNRAKKKGDEKKKMAALAAQEEKATERPGIVIGGLSNIPYRLAGCCNPKYQDRIVGYSHIGEITIHKRTCSMLDNVNIERLLPCHWEGLSSVGMTISFELILRNKLGVLKKLTDIFFSMDMNLEEIRVNKIDETLSKVHLVMSCPDDDYYIFERLVDKVRVLIPEFESASLISME